MVGPPNDTTEIRVWLASQLKLEDVPEPIWGYLVEERYVKEAQDPDYADARGNLVAQARKLLRIHSAGAAAPKVPKRRRTRKRRKATDQRRSEVIAEIAAKISQAKANKDANTPANADEKKPKTPTPEEWARRTAHLPRKPDLQELGSRGIKPPKGTIAESPIRGEISNNKITVTAEPWVSPEAVRKKFASLRDIWFWTETPSERRVELVDFVAGFCEGYYNEKHGVTGLTLGPRWRWRHLMEQWNQRYPQGDEWHYTDVRNFRRHFTEAFNTLTAHKDF